MTVIESQQNKRLLLTERRAAATNCNRADPLVGGLIILSFKLMVDCYCFQSVQVYEREVVPCKSGGKVAELGRGCETTRVEALSAIRRVRGKEREGQGMSRREARRRFFANERRGEREWQ
jgi:hypothetical protein